MKIICDNSRDDESVIIYKQDFDKMMPIYLNTYKKDLFKVDVIVKSLDLVGNKNDLIIDYTINNLEDLEIITSIMNICPQITFILNISKISFKQKELIEIMNTKIINKENVRVKYQENSNDISLAEYYKMYYRIYNMVNEISDFELSPLEQIMFVYDIVKSRIYCDNLDDYDKARNLHEVINNKYIVCAGYANMMEFILHELGHNIYSLAFCYENSEEGHMRNLIQIKDDKYNMSGLFFLDVTYDSKKSDDIDNLNNYTAFMKSYNYFKSLNPTEQFMSNNYKVLQCEQESNDKFDLTNNDESISPNQFFECLYNIRKKQYEIKTIDYMPTLDEFEQIMVANFGLKCFNNSKNH